MDIEEIRSVLSVKLDVSNEENLKSQLADAEVLQVQVSKAYRNSKEELEVARNRMLLPKHKDYTDMDRNIRLESDTAMLQRETDELKDLLTILDTRLRLGRSFLGSEQN